jgi:hypothetical protein
VAANKEFNIISLITKSLLIATYASKKLNLTKKLNKIELV